MDTKLYPRAAATPMGFGDRWLRNRLAVAPMSRVNAGPDGIPTDDMAAYYARYAEGGFALIITEGTYTDGAYSQAYAAQPGLVTPAQMRGWRKVTDAVHAKGGLIIAQLMHAGALSQHLSRAIAPSVVQPVGVMMSEYGGQGPFPLPAEMTREDIRVLTDGFVQAAMYAQQAGFDGVEVHAANGYLLDQLLTPHLNLRTDEYGGVMANKFRIIGDIIGGVQAGAPAGFITGLRLSEGKVNDLAYRWPEGAAMAREVLEQVKLAGPTYVHIAAEHGDWRRDCLYEDGHSYGRLAGMITGLPVIVNGGLHRPDVAEEVLENGHGDILALGKAALADPFWPRRMGLFCVRDGI
ncbi:MAG: NADH:flavin oxidoreductase [Chitinophagaceae bacterium]|nr:NADH:flavin oxidoreductase [Chitinophagaceae bacterium]